MASRAGPPELASVEPVVRAFLASRLLSSELEDATQTVMQRALERREAFETADRPRAWVLGVARNVAFEVIRARARAPVSSSGIGPLDSAPDPLPTAEEQLGLAERHHLLYRALHGLRLEDQLALLMTYVDGLPGPAAAELLGVSFAAFRQRLSRARRQAERKIRDLAEEPPRVDPAVARSWQRFLQAEDAQSAAEALRASEQPSEAAPTASDDETPATK